MDSDAKTMPDVLQETRKRTRTSPRRTGPLEIGDYLRILREGWLVLVAVLLACLAASGVATALQTPMYVAEATLFVTVDSETDSAYERSQFARQRVASYAQIVDSPEVLDPVREELDLPTGLAGLKGRVDAENPTETVLLLVTAEAASGQEAAAIANSAALHLSSYIQKLEAGSTAGDSPSAPTLTVPATAPSQATEPRPLVNMGLGLVLGLSAGSLAALLRHRFYMGVLRSRTSEQDFGLRTVGRVPAAGGGRTGRAKPVRPAYRAAVASLHLMNDGAVPKRILLLPVDAASAAELAVPVLGQVLADLGHRVCFVEGDRSAPAAFPDLAVSPGAADLIVGKAPLRVALQRVESVPMNVLTAGDPEGLLRPFDVAGRIHPVLEELESGHDVVLVRSRFDEPPLDAALLAPFADCVLLVGRDSRTAKSDVDAVLRELVAARVKPTGFLLIGRTTDPDRSNQG